MNKYLLFLEKYFAAFLIKILGITWKFKVQNEKPKGEVIYTFWHRNMVPLMYFHRGENIVILVSPSKDGELIAGPAKLFGYKFARGSSGKKGISGTKKMIKFAKNNSLAITPDGPKGPSEKLKDGVLFLSYLTKLPILPTAVDASKEVVFNSWDKFRLPKFFSKISISYGKPIYINSKEEIKEKKKNLQNELNELTIKNKLR